MKSTVKRNVNIKQSPKYEKIISLQIKPSLACNDNLAEIKSKCPSAQPWILDVSVLNNFQDEKSKISITHQRQIFK